MKYHDRHFVTEKISLQHHIPDGLTQTDNLPSLRGHATDTVGSCQVPFQGNPEDFFKVFRHHFHSERPPASRDPAPSRP